MTLPLSDEPINAKNYQDLNTGCIYELDETTGDYFLVYCPPGSGGGIMLGEYHWETTRGAPAAGQASLAANPVAGTPNTLYVSETALDGTTRVAYLSQIAAGDVVWVDDGAGVLMKVTVTATPTDYGTYWGIPFTPASSTEPADGAQTTISLVQAATGGSGPPPDISPPPVPVLKSLASQNIQQEDGTPLTNIIATVGYTTPPSGLIDLATIIIQSTRFGTAADATQPDWTVATLWTAPSADATGTLDTNVIQPTVLAATKYWVRAQAVDKVGNQSAMSSVLTIITASDIEGPPRPSGIVLQPGMSVFGVTWDDIAVDDLAYVEVQWRTHSPVGDWSSVQVAGTIVVITGVVNGTTYDVRLRSVDRSGNALDDTGTVDADGNPIFATIDVTDSANVNKGFVTAGTVTPSSIPADTLVWSDAIIGNIFAGKINADWIKAGTLVVGGGTGQVAAITVVDAVGNIVGRWTYANGIELFDPANPSYKMTLDESGLFIWNIADPANPVAVVSLTPLGIDAASITFGSARGGHNLVQNSSFELGDFSATVTTTTNSVWDLSADWTAGVQGSNVNITVGASALTMTP